MNRWAWGLALAVWIACVPLGAQVQDAPCSSTPPEHKVDRDGNLLPEFRNWDSGQCAFVFQEPPSGAVVSVRALEHKTPKAARREFERGVQAWRRGKREEAERRLTEAVRLDPGFAQAQIELGAMYVEARQPELGLECFERALAAVPDSAAAYTAKASALVMLNRAEDTEEAARQALALDPTLTAAHYLLGLALLMQDKLTPEAAEHLRDAADRYPRAGIWLAAMQNWLERRGNSKN